MGEQRVQADEPPSLHLPRLTTSTLSFFPLRLLLSLVASISCSQRISASATKGLFTIATTQNGRIRCPQSAKDQDVCTHRPSSRHCCRLDHGNCGFQRSRQNRRKAGMVLWTVFSHDTCNHIPHNDTSIPSNPQTGKSIRNGVRRFPLLHLLDLRLRLTSKLQLEREMQRGMRDQQGCGWTGSFHLALLVCDNIHVSVRSFLLQT